MTEFRTEHDSMGDVQVPAQAYYGAQTQRAVENFPISGWQLPGDLIHALGRVKSAAAVANRDLGKLTGSGKNPLSDEQVEYLLAACREVTDGKLDAEFPIDVFQTGSGTSSNMNVNEVIANRAIELCGSDRFTAEKPIHPNDHVNMGQSTNDMFPTAIHVAVAIAVQSNLVPALERFRDSLAAKAADWDQVIKIGRTHLADATPLRLGRKSADWPGNSTSRSTGQNGHSQPSSNCPREELPSAVVSTHIRSSGPAWPRHWPGTRESPSSRQQIISRPMPSGTRWSSVTAS